MTKKRVFLYTLLLVDHSFPYLLWSQQYQFENHASHSAYYYFYNVEVISIPTFISRIHNIRFRYIKTDRVYSVFYAYFQSLTNGIGMIHSPLNFKIIKFSDVNSLDQNT